MGNICSPRLQEVLSSPLAGVPLQIHMNTVKLISAFLVLLLSLYISITEQIVIIGSVGAEPFFPALILWVGTIWLEDGKLNNSVIETHTGWFMSNVWGKILEKYKLYLFTMLTSFNVSHMLLWQHSWDIYFNFYCTEEVCQVCTFLLILWPSAVYNAGCKSSWKNI